MTHEIEGPHAEIGAQLASKYEIDSKIVTTIREHHDSEFTTTESFIVAAQMQLVHQGQEREEILQKHTLKG